MNSCKDTIGLILDNGINPIAMKTHSISAGAKRQHLYYGFSICQRQPKENFEKLAKQAFQNFLWVLMKCKALYCKIVRATAAFIEILIKFSRLTS